MKITRDGAFQISYVDGAGQESAFRCTSEFADWVMAHEDAILLLQKIEWRGEYDHARDTPRCPECGHNQIRGHDAACDLVLVVEKAKSR